VPQPAVPWRCPLGADGSECRVGIHSKRERKTGPCVPLTVAHCHRHGLYFTLYPPAHVPYGRAAVAPLDLAGRRVEAAEPGGFATAGTLWQATVDAAAGKTWPEAGGLEGCRRTQGRRLERGVTFFALPGTARIRELLASALRVPALVLHEASSAFAQAAGWRDKATLIVPLLERCLDAAERVLVAGHVAGLWGQPSRWDPGGGRLRLLV